VIVNPRIGSSVLLRYRKSMRPFARLHDRVGIVRIVSRGPGPRNHGIEVDGQTYVVPCGQLRSVDLRRQP
jgi:hypothetical protein